MEYSLTRHDDYRWNYWSVLILVLMEYSLTVFVNVDIIFDEF